MVLSLAECVGKYLHDTEDPRAGVTIVFGKRRDYMALIAKTMYPGKHEED
jgi:hypothetical protein